MLSGFSLAEGRPRRGRATLADLEALIKAKGNRDLRERVLGVQHSRHEARVTSADVSN